MITQEDLNKLKIEYPEEYCWATGNYTSECDCEFCNHKEECSGYDGEED